LSPQQQQPVRGDWFSDVSRTVQDLDIGLNIEEIRSTNRSIFRKLSKQKSEEAAFTALKERRDGGKKGKILYMEAA
jgi:hypothetical protein